MNKKTVINLFKIMDAVQLIQSMRLTFWIVQNILLLGFHCNAKIFDVANPLKILQS